jgi:hypothetical protein
MSQPAHLPPRDLQGEHLQDQVGSDRFRTLCLLTDLQMHVADVWREYITSGGNVAGLQNHLCGAERVLNELRGQRPGGTVPATAASTVSPEQYGQIRDVIWQANGMATRAGQATIAILEILGLKVEH